MSADEAGLDMAGRLPVIPVFEEPGEKRAGVAEAVQLAKGMNDKDAAKPTAHQRTMAELQYATLKHTAADRFPVALVVDARGVTTEAALAEFERGVTQVRVQARAVIQLEKEKAVEAAAHARRDVLAGQVAAAASDLTLRNEGADGVA